VTATTTPWPETVNGYYKAELIRGPARTGPWKTVEEVELATLGWVHWHNTQRLHGYLGDLPPVEFEQLHATQNALETPDPGVLPDAGAARRAAERLTERRSQPESAQIAPGSLPGPSAVAAQVLAAGAPPPPGEGQDRSKNINN